MEDRKVGSYGADQCPIDFGVNTVRKKRCIQARIELSCFCKKEVFLRLAVNQLAKRIFPKTECLVKRFKCLHSKSPIAACYVSHIRPVGELMQLSLFIHHFREFKVSIVKGAKSSFRCIKRKSRPC